MPSFLIWIVVGLGVALLFTLAIFVHELGHYWVARLCGLKVEGFSIGFGPKIFGWTDRHGVPWAIRWIPAGGFVRLPQMITSEMIEGRSEGGLPPIQPWKKILVALAGPFMNVVLAFALGTLIWLVGVPKTSNNTIVGSVEADSAEGRLGIKEGDKILSIEGERVGSWVDIQDAAIVALTNVLKVEIEHPDGTRAFYPVPTEFNEQFHLKLLPLGPKEHPAISKVEPGSVAETAGLKAGDVFVSFDGVQIVGQRQLIGLINKRHGHRSVVEVLRGTNTVHFDITPILDPVRKVGRIGIEIGSPPVLTIDHPTPWEQITASASRIFKFVQALTHQKQSSVGVEHLHGPVMIFSSLASELRIDPRLAISLLVMLNINLAMLNLLPLPVLDGGHIVIGLFEIATGRSIGARLQEALSLTFALLLMAFMLFVTSNDISALFRFRGSGKAEKADKTESTTEKMEKEVGGTNAVGR